MAIAPDLSYVADRRPEPEWRLQHFLNPASVSPGSFMPNFIITDGDSISIRLSGNFLTAR